MDSTNGRTVMAAHSGSRVKFKEHEILYSYETRNSAKGSFTGAPITNYAASSEGTQGSNYTGKRLPSERKLRKMTNVVHKPVYVYGSTSDWVDIKNTGTDVVLADGETIFVSVYVMPLSTNNRFNCQLNVTGVNSNLGIGGGSSTHDLPRYRWTRLWFKWTNNTGVSRTVTSTRVECYTNEEWSGSRVKVIGTNFQVEKHGSEITEPTPYTNESTRSISNRKSLFGKQTVNYSTAHFSSDGKTVYFRGQGERDGSPTGDYIAIPSGDCTTNPAVRPDGVTYSWWQNADDLNRRSLFFGSGTINHIEQNPPGFRTEARLRNGHSFGASGANQVAGVWENYAIVFDNITKRARWYKNGVLFHDGNLTNANGQHDYFEPNSIGRATGSSNYLYAPSWKGYFDCFYVYDGRLTEEQIKKVYHANKSFFDSL